MKRASLFFALVVALILVIGYVESWKVGVSGESTTLDDGFVIAEIGYSHSGRSVLYAVFRSFPTNSTPLNETTIPVTKTPVHLFW